jgi:REP element-mobilizing transposase RayT
MGRSLRILPPGAIAHITNRGVAGHEIFLADDDRKLFLRLLEVQVVRRRWNCLAYCLMDNHFHLLLKAPRGDLSEGMKTFSGGYANMFNKAHHRFGHVFQSRFNAALVEDEAHAFQSARYIALNPVRAGIVDRPGLWPWSSYTAVLENRWLCDGLRSRWFADRAGGRAALRDFVEAGVPVCQAPSRSRDGA